MVIITLVGEFQAKKDETFIYIGPLSECRECKLKTVCFNLEIGRWYRVISLRDVRHECKVHEEGVRVTEVEPVEIFVSIPSVLAVDRASFSYKPRKCSVLSCDNYRLCHPLGITAGNKFHITSVEGDIKCEMGYSLKKVKIF